MELIDNLATGIFEAVPTTEQQFLIDTTHNRSSFGGL
jgi:hypothetical protein